MFTLVGSHQSGTSKLVSFNVHTHTHTFFKGTQAKKVGKIPFLMVMIIAVANHTSIFPKIFVCTTQVILHRR